MYHMHHSFSPLARAVMDCLPEGIAVFDRSGHLLYANRIAESAMDSLGRDVRGSGAELLRELTQTGARVAPLRVGDVDVGDAVFLPGGDVSDDTLAAREKQAIIDTLESTGWRLAESARKLGISRTTLWRRLKEYGLQGDGRGRWSRSS